jgi:hypothetical protein
MNILKNWVYFIKKKKEILNNYSKIKNKIKMKKIKKNI